MFIKKIFLFITILFIGLTAAPRKVPVSFDGTSGGSAVHPQLLNGTCLPIWNTTGTYNSIRAGLISGKYQLFRFPNGSISNDYHWNGNGGFNEHNVWINDTTAYKPGFVCITKYRGTSKYHYGLEGYSLVTDGDTATYWWSDPLITEKAPYAYLIFPDEVNADSIEIYWGAIYGVDFTIDYWTGNGDYPGPHQLDSDEWHPLQHVTGNDRKVYRSALDSTVSFKYLRVNITESSRPDSGVQLAEVYVFKGNEPVSKNTGLYRAADSGQTRVIATSTHGGSEVRQDYEGWVDWDFETFMTYIGNLGIGTQAVICVNYGTGTPEEAAQWVRYANIKKGYHIRYWQVGNEMDGYWEEGGPLSALTYAQRYYIYAKAMKAADPTIKILGPVLSHADFTGRASGDYNGLSWMETFLKYMGEKEVQDNVKYVDGVDFHSYPYYFTGSPDDVALFEGSDYVYERSDTLLAMIRSYLEKPESVMVSMSEYNGSVAMCDLLMKPVNSTVIANMYGGFVEKFGYRGMTVVWDSFESMSEGPDKTWGGLTLFTTMIRTARGSIGPAPTATFWGMYVPGNIWLKSETDNVLQVIKSDYERSGVNLRAYGVRNDDCCNLLYINGADSVTVQSSLTGMDFDYVDVYTWSEDNFGWIGSDDKAYGMPNCGPVSKRMNSADFSDPTLPPYSMAVLRFHNQLSSDSAPRIMRTGMYPTALFPNDTLHLWGTVTTAGGIITSITIELTNEEPVTIASLDDNYDGPMESFFTAIPSGHLKGGKQNLIIRVVDSKGDACIDTLNFINNGSAVREKTTTAPVLNGLNILRAGDNLHFFWNSFGKTAPVRLSIYDLRGMLVHSSGLLKPGTTGYQWAPKKNRKAATTLNIIRVNSGNKTLQRSCLTVR